MTRSARILVRERTRAKTLPAAPGSPAPVNVSTAGLGEDSWASFDEIMGSVYAESRAMPLVEEFPHLDTNLVGYDLGSLVVTTLESTPFRVERTTQHARRSEGGDFILVLATEGSGVVHQDGRAEKFEVGDFFFVDTDKTYLGDYRGGHEAQMKIVTLTMPRQAILSRSAAAEHLTATSFGATSGMGTVLNPMLRALPDAFGRLDDVTGQALADNIYDLLGTALNERAGQAPRISATLAAHRTDLRRAKNHFKERLRDPELTLLTASMDLGFSLRYLHQIFRADGTTPQKWIYAQRLERARRQLRMPAAPPIADIAAAAGFKDPSHFTRAFKNRYGTTPGAYRRAEQVPP